MVPDATRVESAAPADSGDRVHAVPSPVTPQAVGPPCNGDLAQKITSGQLAIWHLGILPSGFAKPLPPKPVFVTNPSWATPPSINMPWISASQAPLGVAPAGFYEYATAFCLCAGGYQNGKSKIQMRADDLAVIVLNNQLVDILGLNQAQSLPKMIDMSGFLGPGNNTLRVFVMNKDDGSPTGFTLSGYIEAPGGKCGPGPMGP